MRYFPRTPLLAILLILPLGAAAQEGGLKYENGKGLSVEAGTLGGSGSPLLGRSAYVGAELQGQGSGNWLDWNYALRAVGAQVKARWFADVPPSDSTLPVSPAVDPTTPGATQSMLFLGALANVGRAFALGPVDLAWNVTGMARVDALLPTVGLDETVSARTRLGQHSVAASGGYNQGIQVISRSWLESLIGGTSKSDVRMVGAPHAAVSAWGPLARVADYEASIGVQKNPYTNVVRFDGSLTKGLPNYNGRLSATARVENENGALVGFSRRERALGLALAQNSGATWGVELTSNKVGYGDASAGGKSVWLTLRLQEPDRSAVSFAVGRGSYEVREPTLKSAASVTNALHDGVASIDGFLASVQSAIGSASGPELALALRVAFARLPPDMQASIEAELGGPINFTLLGAEITAGLPSATAELARERKQTAQLEEALSDPARLERILTRWLRVAAYESLVTKTVNLWGRDVAITPALTLAMIHAYGTGITPLTPALTDDTEKLFEDRLISKINRDYSLNCPTSDLVGCAIDSLPAMLKTQLQGMPADKARQALSDALGLVHETVVRELNLVALNFYVSARQLDRVTVDRGERLGVIADAAVRSHYQNLDRRRDASARDRAYEFGERHVRAELEESALRVAAARQARAEQLSERAGDTAPWEPTGRPSENGK